MFMNRLAQLMNTPSWKATFPLMAGYQSRRTGYIDIDLAEVLDRERSLFFDPRTPTGFAEVATSPIPFDQDKFDRDIEPPKDEIEAANDLIFIIKEYFRKLYKPYRELLQHSHIFLNIQETD